MKGRAKGAVQDRKDAVMAKIGIAGDKVSEETPSGDDVRQGPGTRPAWPRENPLGLAIGALAGGFLAGLPIPSTRIEERTHRPMTDEVKDRAREAGQQAIEHGKEAAQDVASSATEQVQGSLRTPPSTRRRRRGAGGRRRRAPAGERGRRQRRRPVGRTSRPARRRGGRAPSPDQRRLGRGPEGQRKQVEARGRVR